MQVKKGTQFSNFPLMTQNVLSVLNFKLDEKMGKDAEYILFSMNVQLFNLIIGQMNK